MAQRALTAVLALTIVAAGLGAGQAAAGGRPGRETAILVHGLDPFGRAGADCRSWTPLRAAFERWGGRGRTVPVAYYAHDRHCTLALDAHGRHAGAGGHDRSGRSHTADASIAHLAHHLAWAVYDRWSRRRVSIDAVGNSMGGLIIRYALHAVETDRAGFPPRLLIDDAVTLGTPHAGAGLARLCPYSRECREMRPRSPFMARLRRHAANPQGARGTDWTAIGSYADRVVPARSATAMRARHRVLYRRSMGIGHSGYRRDTSRWLDADTEHSRAGGRWMRRPRAPHVVAQIWRALGSRQE